MIGRLVPRTLCDLSRRSSYVRMLFRIRKAVSPGLQWCAILGSWFEDPRMRPSWPPPRIWLTDSTCGSVALPNMSTVTETTASPRLLFDRGLLNASAILCKSRPAASKCHFYSIQTAGHNLEIAVAAKIGINAVLQTFMNCFGAVAKLGLCIGLHVCLSIFLPFNGKFNTAKEENGIGRDRSSQNTYQWRTRFTRFVRRSRACWLIISKLAWKRHNQRSCHPREGHRDAKRACTHC